MSGLSDKLQLYHVYTDTNSLCQMCALFRALLKSDVGGGIIYGTVCTGCVKAHGDALCISSLSQPNHQKTDLSWFDREKLTWIIGNYRQAGGKERGSGEIINIYLWKEDWNLWNFAPICEIIFEPIKDSFGQWILQIPTLNYLSEWQNVLGRLLVS